LDDPLEDPLPLPLPGPVPVEVLLDPGGYTVTVEVNEPSEEPVGREERKKANVK